MNTRGFYGLVIFLFLGSMAITAFRISQYVPDVPAPEHDQNGEFAPPPGSINPVFSEEQNNQNTDSLTYLKNLSSKYKNELDSLKKINSTGSAKALPLKKASGRSNLNGLIIIDDAPSEQSGLVIDTLR